MLQTHPASSASPEGASSATIVRKVASSGHISYQGHPYFISKRLAGTWLDVRVLPSSLLVETAIPLRKTLPLSQPPVPFVAHTLPIRHTF